MISTRTNTIFLLFLLISCVPSFGYSQNQVGIRFFAGDLPQLQEQARQSQTPYLISVYTSWCDPCQKLNRQTFTDPRLSQFVNEHYLAYQLDPEYQKNRSDDEMLSTFEVTFYPSILIFSPEGELIHKLSGYQSPDDLMWMLKEVAPSQSEPAVETTIITETSFLMEESQPMESGLFITDMQEDLAYEYIAEKKPSKRVEAKPAPAPARQRKIESWDPTPTQDYGVQIGVYADYANVERNLTDMQQRFQPELMVRTGQLNGKEVHKLLFGPFDTFSEAQTFLRQYQRSVSTEAVIVKLAGF